MSQSIKIAIVGDYNFTYNFLNNFSEKELLFDLFGKRGRGAVAELSAAPQNFRLRLFSCFPAKKMTKKILGQKL